MSATTERKTKKVTAKMLAKDILKLIDPKTRGKVRLLPEQGMGYIRICKNQKNSERAAGFDGKDLQAIIQGGKPCQVCGIGAFVVAKALRLDEINYYDNLSRSRCVDELSDILSASEALAIEEVFEGGPCCGPESRRDSLERLKRICKNIIARRPVGI